ncbi:MAG: hypothetical protein DME07_14045 [Candidatus Rokuibacteriota bacterium]|nr:MAG: hypothetical protein DME07_14045 [Candidatus Rokubacteria bacterium]
MIGAAAMAVHGVSRATRDIDLFTLSQECLETSFWTSLRTTASIEAYVRKGDAADPLAGVVRLTAAGENPLDVVVGKSSWQRAVTERAQDAVIEDVAVRVAGALDLILLKLYAAGPQDAWDVEQLLTGSDEPALVAQIDVAVRALPPDGRALWARIRAGRRPA